MPGKQHKFVTNKLHSHTQLVETREADLLKYIFKTVLCPYGTLSAFKLNQTGDVVYLFCFASNFQTIH